MRYYSFTNFYLSSIQQGIQPAHCISDTFLKYADECRQREILLDWAANHKTMICLNGGNAAGIRDIYHQLQRFGELLHLPFCRFYEDQDSLDTTMTCCGVIVPESMYNLATAIRKAMPHSILDITGAGVDVDPVEYEFAVWLNQFSLAK